MRVSTVVLAGFALVFALGLVPGAEPRAQADRDSVRANDGIEGKDHDAARAGVQKGQLVPLQQVVDSLSRQYPGRMLDASLHELVPGQPVYRIVWLLPDNRRLTIWVDATTGQVARVEGA